MQITPAVLCKITQGDVVLTIRSRCALDEERVKRTFENQCTEFLARLENDRKRNSFKQLCKFIIGSFTVWESANIRIPDNPEIRIYEMFLKRLKQAEITFQYDSEN